MAIKYAQVQSTMVRARITDKGTMRAQGTKQWPLPERYFKSRSQIERRE